ncbi:hypothetical protein K491DRAFT_463086 [Lophiostoma macrostomum CBS 122681]|uniref:Uncharacterized protein n=1 Tax=Lophiostoma macrostomum CBS 122681 TaxID=1314788 RepID=A0A6A6T3P2_9PLEO|nr:hypothetical protein K491DRAFT_463086 [Lophiostoma macrostomum CBS 122681]
MSLSLSYPNNSRRITGTPARCLLFLDFFVAVVGQEADGGFSGSFVSPPTALRKIAHFVHCKRFRQLGNSRAGRWSSKSYIS